MESDRPGDRPNDRPNDRRGELLDRAYRRGYALRRRRRWTATLAGLAAAHCQRGHGRRWPDGRGDDTRRSRSCRRPTTETAGVGPSPCSVPINAVPAEVPSDVAAWAGGAPVIGEGGLWTIVSATHVAPHPRQSDLPLEVPVVHEAQRTPADHRPPARRRRRVSRAGLISPPTCRAPGSCRRSNSRLRDVGRSLLTSVPQPWVRFSHLPAPSTVVLLTDNDGLGLHFVQRAVPRRPGLRLRRPLVERRGPNVDTRRRRARHRVRGLARLSRHRAGGERFQRVGLRNANVRVP